MPLHALELVPDDAGQDAVRRDWQRLGDSGLPIHLGNSRIRAPHLTVVAAPSLPDAALDVARARLGSLLPIRARAAGLLLFGGDRLTIARAVDIEDDVVRRVLAVRVQVPDRQHAGWLPHVTLARGVERAFVQRAVDVLAQGDAELTLTELRRWDPDRNRVTTVVGSLP